MKANQPKTSEELLELVVRTSDDKLAEETVALDVKNLSGLADFFVITQGRNEKHIEAIVDAIVEAAHKEGVEIKNIEGRHKNPWTLIDLNDVIVHVFHPNERAHYDLEKLWHDAPFYDISSWVSR